MSKKKIAIYGASGCRTCEHMMLEIHYQVSPMFKNADIVFWPYGFGSLWKDFESADICFFAGAVQTSADREAAVTLRKKSEIVTAVGACAAFGGLPGLANLKRQKPGAAAGSDGLPALPRLEPRVSALSQIIDVEYVLPGCPPTQSLLWTAMQAAAGGTDFQAKMAFAASRLPEKIAQAMASGILPPDESVFAGEKAVCASCSRIKEEKKFEFCKRPYEAYEETGRCLLEQGLICQGIATREGCGGICTGAGIPCRGCFGKAEAVFDPGAKMVSAVSSTFDAQDAAEIEKLADSFADMSGSFYRYTAPTQCVLLAGE